LFFAGIQFGAFEPATFPDSHVRSEQEWVQRVAAHTAAPALRESKPGHVARHHRLFLPQPEVKFASLADPPSIDYALGAHLDGTQVWDLWGWSQIFSNDDPQFGAAWRSEVHVMPPPPPPDSAPVSAAVAAAILVDDAILSIRTSGGLEFAPPMHSQQQVLPALLEQFSHPPHLSLAPTPPVTSPSTGTMVRHFFSGSCACVY
jgi:hypothetical protein